MALQNNYDIAIQRYNLNIADTDILRQGGQHFVWREQRAGDRDAGRRGNNGGGRRRSGRNQRGLGWRGRGRERSDPVHKRRWAAAGERGPGAGGADPTTKGDDGGAEYSVLSKWIADPEL